MSSMFRDSAAGVSQKVVIAALPKFCAKLQSSLPDWQWAVHLCGYIRRPTLRLYARTRDGSKIVFCYDLRSPIKVGVFIRLPKRGKDPPGRHLARFYNPTDRLSR